MQCKLQFSCQEGENLDLRGFIQLGRQDVSDRKSENTSLYVIRSLVSDTQGFTGVSKVKNPPANGGDIRYMSPIPGSRSPGGGNGNSLQYSCLGNQWGCKESDMTWQLNNNNKNDTREWPQAEFKHAAATVAKLFGGGKGL